MNRISKYAIDEPAVEITFNVLHDVISPRLLV